MASPWQRMRRRVDLDRELFPVDLRWQRLEEARQDPDGSAEKSVRLVGASERERGAPEIEVAFGALLEPHRPRVESIRTFTLAPERMDRAEREQRGRRTRAEGDSSFESHAGGREKFGPFRCRFLRRRGGVAQEVFAFRLCECRERAHGREDGDEKPERREENASAANGRGRFGSASRDAAKRHAREEGCGPRGDRDPKRKVAEGEKRHGAKRSEKRVGRRGRKRRRLLLPPAGGKNREASEGRPGGCACGGKAGLGRERDGLAMSVVEVGGAAPVPQPPARAFLGREARGDESVRERARACAEEGPRAKHLPRREESDVALCGGRRDVTPSKLVELHESPPARSRRSREEGGEGDGEEREPPPAKIERDEDDRPRAEGERRPDGLRREKAEERRHEAE